MHILPGRVRIRFTKLKKNRLLAENLQAFLEEVPEVREVQVNPLTGSCLIHFDKNISAHSLVEAAKMFMQKQRGNENLVPLQKPSFQEPSKQTGLKQVLAGGAVLTLFWGLPPVGTTLPPGLSLPVASAALVTTGYPVFKSGLEYWGKHQRPNYDFIVGVISLISTVTGRGYLGLLTIWLSTVSKYLQGLAFKTASNSFSNILIKKGNRVALLEGRQVRPVLPGDIVPGDTVVFGPGDCIPVEGEVLSGEASGFPGEKFLPGQHLQSGTHLADGHLVVKVHRVVEDTSLSRLADILDDAIGEPEAGNHLALSYAERLLPITLLTTVLVYTVTRDFQRAVSVLLAGAPGPAGLAAPTALSASTGVAAGMGIAVKDRTALENLGHVDMVVFGEKDFTRGSAKLPPVLKKLEEEGFKVEDFDPRHIHEGNDDFHTGQVNSDLAAAAVERMHQRGIQVAWVSGPEDPTFIENADVNIMFAKGKEKQVPRAQIICYKSDPRQVYRAIDLSRKTLHTIQQNVFLVQGMNLLGQTLGALGVISSVPAMGMTLLATLTVVFNSARSLLSMNSYKNPGLSGNTIQGLLVDRGKCFSPLHPSHEK